MGPQYNAAPNIIGVIKGDTRSLDYGSYGAISGYYRDNGKEMEITI